MPSKKEIKKKEKTNQALEDKVLGCSVHTNPVGHRIN